MTTHKGTCYWPTYAEARKAAQAAGWPTDRIILYGRGWAVQIAKGGAYMGPPDLSKDGA